MSLETRMDRSIKIIRTSPMEARDSYNNQVVHEVTFGPYSAARNLTSTEEDRADRDSTSQTFRYLISSSANAFSAHDRIIDDGETLEIIGEVERVRGAIGLHHFECNARIIKG